MAYYIFEDGRTIGPLKVVEVLERAQPNTLVSHGQEWVRLDQHPDLGRATPAASTVLPTGSKSTDDGIAAQRDVPVGSRVPLKEKRTGCRSMIRKAALVSSVILLLLIAGFVALMILIPVDTTTVSIDPEQLPPENEDRGETRPSPKVEKQDSQPTGQNIDERLSELDVLIEEEFKKIRPLDRKFKLIRSRYPWFGVGGDIRGSGPGWVLIYGNAESSSPGANDHDHPGVKIFGRGNLQVVGNIETRESGYFSHQKVYYVETKTVTDNAGNLVPVKVYTTEAPREYLDAEREMKSLLKQMEPLYEQKDLLQAKAASLRQAKQQRGNGYAGIPDSKAMNTSGPVGNPMEVSGDEQGSPQKSAMSDRKLQELIEAKNALRDAMKPIEVELKPLLAKYPTFTIDAEIISYRDQIVWVAGTATPSNNDQDHPGTALSQTHLAIGMEVHEHNSLLYYRQGLYYVNTISAEIREGETVQVKIYAPIPTPDNLKPVARMVILQDELAGYHTKIDELDNQIRELSS